MVQLQGAFGTYADRNSFLRMRISTVVRNWGWMLKKSLVGLILLIFSGLREFALENLGRLCVRDSSIISADLGVSNFPMRTQGWLFRIKETEISDMSDLDEISFAYLPTWRMALARGYLV